ncbi:hypothetical protein GJ744_009183 [Endocarpon pusillum]|uniref:Uncharacterized protein n=1 Tax=Endocarpon pusillum TaxID=364733 RepID=A0A8H7AG18_9EURO|nr:hypothetical protein GJ744_009183 [Endocarpon pusillum]
MFDSAIFDDPQGMVRLQLRKCTFYMRRLCWTRAQCILNIRLLIVAAFVEHLEISNEVRVGGIA